MHANSFLTPSLPILSNLSNAISAASCLSNANAGNCENPGQSFSMIEPHTKVVETKLRQYFTRGCTNLRFNNHRTRSKHVDVALVKLSKPAHAQADPRATPAGFDNA